MAEASTTVTLIAQLPDDSGRFALRWRADSARPIPRLRERHAPAVGGRRFRRRPAAPGLRGITRRLRLAGVEDRVRHCILEDRHQLSLQRTMACSSTLAQRFGNAVG